jgi:hypothetical protein
MLSFVAPLWCARRLFSATKLSARSASLTRRVSLRGRRSEPENLVLARPSWRKLEHTSDADPVRQPAFDRGLDEGRSEEREREGHINVALAAVLAGSEGLHGRQTQVIGRRL